jgi:hypothetical protein
MFEIIIGIALFVSSLTVSAFVFYVNKAYGRFGSLRTAVPAVQQLAGPPLVAGILAYLLYHKSSAKSAAESLDDLEKADKTEAIKTKRHHRRLATVAKNALAIAVAIFGDSRVDSYMNRFNTARRAADLIDESIDDVFVEVDRSDEKRAKTQAIRTCEKCNSHFDDAVSATCPMCAIGGPPNPSGSMPTKSGGIKDSKEFKGLEAAKENKTPMQKGVEKLWDRQELVAHRTGMMWVFSALFSMVSFKRQMTRAGPVYQASQKGKNPITLKRSCDGKFRPQVKANSAMLAARMTEFEAHEDNYCPRCDCYMRDRNDLFDHANQSVSSWVRFTTFFWMVDKAWCGATDEPAGRMHWFFDLCSRKWTSFKSWWTPSRAYSVAGLLIVAVTAFGVFAYRRKRRSPRYNDTLKHDPTVPGPHNGFSPEGECIHVADCPKQLRTTPSRDCNQSCGGHHCTHFKGCLPLVETMPKPTSVKPLRKNKSKAKGELCDYGVKCVHYDPLVKRDMLAKHKADYPDQPEPKWLSASNSKHHNAFFTHLPLGRTEMPEPSGRVMKGTGRSGKGKNKGRAQDTKGVKQKRRKHHKGYTGKKDGGSTFQGYEKPFYAGAWYDVDGKLTDIVTIYLMDGANTMKEVKVARTDVRFANLLNEARQKGWTARYKNQDGVMGTMKRNEKLEEELSTMYSDDDEDTEDFAAREEEKEDHIYSYNPSEQVESINTAAPLFSVSAALATMKAVVTVTKSGVTYTSNAVPVGNGVLVCKHTAQHAVSPPTVHYGPEFAHQVTLTPFNDSKKPHGGYELDGDHILYLRPNCPGFPKAYKLGEVTVGGPCRLVSWDVNNSKNIATSHGRVAELLPKKIFEGEIKTPDGKIDDTIVSDVFKATYTSTQGHSGGAVLNEHGHLIGTHTGSEAGHEGFAFFSPLTLAERARITNCSQSKNGVTGGSLGLQAQ